uniref:Genome sequencing data, contig C296 n=1 Tax=Microcystis aeruginosa (strain PCC 7806) TaxID=267872 RepID=A8YE28_MICA7|nr:unnamed protein product [Microcystis aeruginosa PCC 7806]
MITLPFYHKDSFDRVSRDQQDFKILHPQRDRSRVL